jgi:predicted site-specific integrase-resolvase
MDHSPKDVADALGVAPRTAQRLMASGQIESYRAGPKEKRLRCQPEAVERYRARQLARYRRPQEPRLAA